MNNFILNDFYKNQQQRKTNHWFVPKMVTYLLFFLATNWSFAQGTQDFETQTALTTSYADGSFTENGITYTFVHSRDEGDYSITGKGIILRRINENSHIEWTIPNGVGTLSFDARKAFTGGNNNRQLELLVNGTSVWTSPTFGTSGEDTTIYPFSITLDEQGSTTIRIKIGGTATGNRQVTIDNISWTGYTSSLPPPCIVNIPDANFKAYLVGNTAINTNGDTEIQCDEATAFTGLIDCFNQNISDLTGIEAFVNITELHCYYNPLGSLDLSNNTALEVLYCENSQLSSLDLSNNTALEVLYCENNQLTSLDVSNNTALIDLYCENNQLTSLDVSNNTALIWLYCSYNQLSSLDVSNNTALTDLYCSNNQLSSLDLSNNTALEVLTCDDNQLTSLNLKNGNNTNISNFWLSLTNNPDLLCIQVDDVVYINANWSIFIDATAVFSEDCNPSCIVNIPDANFKAYLVGNAAINTNGDTEIQCDEATAFTGTIDCSGQSIANLTGIEAFVNIIELSCYNNQLTSLDLSNNTALTYLFCSNNPLSSLDLSNNTALETLDCSWNQLSNLDVGNNTALITLMCYNNQLSSLDLSNNTALIELFCNNNELTSLDVSNNTALGLLWCFDNQLSSLDVSNNTALTELYCDTNLLTSLNVSNNTALEGLACYDNQLSSLDVSNNTALTSLHCDNNQLSSLDLSNNTALTTLWCYNNQLSSLDVSNNTALTELFCNDNQLSSLNLKNGNNSNIFFFSLDLTNNPDLLCIQVDDVAYSDANWSSYKDATAVFSEDCNPPCIVNIPDANFKAYLVGNTAINTNGDTEIQCDEATAFTGTIDCSGENIANLTGIEAFVNITELRCHQNQLTSLDVSNNVNITTLRCYSNQLTTLDVSSNVNLTRLYCQDNQLTTLDVSNNDLEYLWCYDNQLTSLNVSNNANMERLLCYNNQLTTLDVSDIIGLLRLETANNQLADLDISNNTSLNRLECNNNQLISLNLKNGNNINFVTLDAKDNPNLACIEVDDAAYSNISWADKKDATAVFSEDCNSLSCIVNIPDANFKAYLVGNTAINTNGDTEIQCDEATAFTGGIYCDGQNIANLTGIEAFVNITELYCSDNQLSSLDLSNNTALEVLYCSENQLTSLDLSNHTALTELECSYNQLSSLDLSNNTALTYLFCSVNPISSLDLSNNTDLIVLACVNNELSSLDLSNHTALEGLNCSYNELSSLDVSNNTALTDLYCENNQLSSLDVSNNTALEYLGCSNNPLSGLDLSNNTALEYLGCSNNPLNSLDLSNNTALEILYCENNQLSGLDLSNNTALTDLWCESNQLTSLDVSNNTVLTFLWCESNQLTSLDLSNNTALEYLWCNDNQLSSLNLKNGNNTNIFLLDLTNNPDLRCIQVDDVAYSNTWWSNSKDDTACFSEDCVTPTFDLPTSVCQSATQTLPTTSSNTILGSWSPATIDTSVVGTQTYIFTPTLCANPYQITISVVAIPDTPTGEENQTFTAGQTLADLVVNGDNLVWYSDATYSNTLSLSEPLVNGATYYVRSENGDCQSEALAITVEEQASRTNFDVFGFKYYPNPVNDILYFSANQPIENVTISNMLGQEIKVNLSSDKTSVDLSNLPSGNYLVKVTIEGVAKTIKVVKR